MTVVLFSGLDCLGSEMNMESKCRAGLRQQDIARFSALLSVLLLCALHAAGALALDCAPPVVQCVNYGDSLASASSLHDKGYYRRAYASAQCALDRVTEPAQQVAALHLAGRSAVRFADYGNARQALQRALDLSATIGDRSLQGRSLYYLGIFHERQKQAELALDHFRRAIAVFDPQQDRAAIADTLFEIGDIEIARSEFDRGIQSYQTAVTHPHNTPGETAKALDYLGYAHRRLGDYAKAIGYHRQALRTVEGMPAGPERASAEARARNHIGLCLRLQALAESPTATLPAIKLLQQAVHEERAGLAAIEPRGLDFRRQGYLQRALALTYLDLAVLQPADKDRQLKLALDAAGAALEIGGKMCDEEWRGLALHALAEIQAQRGRYDEAETRLREAIAIWERIGDRNALGQAWRRMAVNVSLLRNDIGQAREHLRRALLAFESIQARDDMVGVYVESGRLYERAGKPVEARAAYYSAIKLLESTRANVGADENKITYLSRRMEAYEALISLLAREFREHGSRRDGEEAFRISELARGRVLLDMIAQTNAALSARVVPAAIREERRLVERVEGLRRQLAISAQSDAALGRLRTQLRAAEEQLTNHFSTLRQRYPDYTRLKQPVAATLTAVRERVLPAGAVLLEYFIGGKQSFLFVVNNNGLAAILELPLARRALTHAVERLRAPFTEMKQKDARQAGAYLGTAESFDLALAERLYQQLFAPAERYLAGATQIFLVPDGPLFHVPFEALVKKRHASLFSGFQQDVKGSEFLVDHVPPITYAISASLLLGTRPVTGVPRMAAFVNPALRSAAAEVALLEAMHDPAPKVYKESNATRQRFLKDASGFNSFYIATHGEYNEANPMRSGIWFNEGGQERGALVSAADIFNMSLPARLFVLRACETGVGRIQNGEGVMGLARALKYAGARDLVLSLWSVDDASSSDLMAWFYADLPSRGGPRALYEAKHKLRKSEKTYLAHPFFWAPYTYWY
jgi:CHAT domain-containing protein